MSDASVAVIGAGTMGRGIAQIAAQAGYNVWLCDQDKSKLEEARKALSDLWVKLVQKGKLTADQHAACETKLHHTTLLAEAVQPADVIVEAIIEQLQPKRTLWTQIDALAKNTALFGSNTSSIPIAQLATAVTAPERFIGLHFFNPPALVPLLEIVVAPETSEATVARSKTFGERLQRKLVVVKDSPGFATSRLGVVLALEAIRMIEAGVASAADIDTAMEVGYGHAMGPLRTTDLVGLDVRLAIAETLHQTLGGAHYEPPALLRRLVQEGKLGKKAKQGFYAW